MTVTVHLSVQGKGVSSTDQVLEFSKRLGRVADFAYLEIKRCTPKK